MGYSSKSMTISVVARQGPAGTATYRQFASRAFVELRDYCNDADGCGVDRRIFIANANLVERVVGVPRPEALNSVVAGVAAFLTRSAP